MKKLLLFAAVLALSAASFAATYDLGTGCSGNYITCSGVPTIPAGDYFNFGSVGVNNGTPFISGGAFSLVTSTGSTIASGDFTSVRFIGYPSPVPVNSYFPFTMILSNATGDSATFQMEGYKPRYRAAGYYSTGGYLVIK